MTATALRTVAKAPRNAPKPVARRSARTITEAPRKDIYQTVTDQIIEQLEAGVAPWARPWSAGNRPANIALPYSVASGKPYSGVNILLLWGSQIAGGYRSAGWLTFKACADLGGNVRKGSKGTPIVFASQFVPEAERAKPVEDQRSMSFLKTFYVFNVEQCEGLPAELYGEGEPISLEHQIEGAERVIRETGADFRIGGNRAFYAPGPDFIQVPPQISFHEPVNYYRTCFHEIGHWTGSAKRLARKFGTSFGTKDYAREELVAEMSSAFVCASLGISPTVRHADYLGSWLTVLREDNRAIFKAASMASKAADFILQIER